MSTQLAMALASTDGRIFECNRAFQDITGLQKEHVIHASIFKLVDPLFLQETYVNIGLLLKSTSNSVVDPMVDYGYQMPMQIPVSAPPSHRVTKIVSDPNSSSRQEPTREQRSLLHHNSTATSVPSTSGKKSSVSIHDPASQRQVMLSSSTTSENSSSNKRQRAEPPSASILAPLGTISYDIPSGQPSPKYFHIKSLIISAYDGKYLNMAIGVLSPLQLNSMSQRNSAALMSQSVFSVILTPSDDGYIAMK